MPSRSKRPPPACRERLVRAAAAAFREEGYRASIDQIATRAGVARQTLYNHFASKEDLFREVAQLAASDVLVSLDGKAKDLRGHLLRFGAAFRRRIHGDEGLSLYRMVFAEAPRFPELARTFFENGSGATVRAVAVFLERAMAQGELRREDPTYAAETLLAMLDCWDRSRRLYGAPLLTPAAERARIARIVDHYLRAFAPAKDRKKP